MKTITTVRQLTRIIADELKKFDGEKPKFGTYGEGIGPFSEKKLVKEIARRLTSQGIPAQTTRATDMVIGKQWGIEFKIVRPFGDNGKPAEHWSQNLLHPYRGNVSLIGDVRIPRKVTGCSARKLPAVPRQSYRLPEAVGAVRTS